MNGGGSGILGVGGGPLPCIVLQPYWWFKSLDGVILVTLYNMHCIRVTWLYFGEEDKKRER